MRFLWCLGCVEWQFIGLPQSFFFSFFPLSFSKLPRYHFDTNPLLSSTFPVPFTYLSLASTSYTRKIATKKTFFLAHLEKKVYLCRQNCNYSENHVRGTIE